MNAELPTTHGSGRWSGTWGFPLDRMPKVMRNHGYVRSKMFWLRADSPRIKLPPGLLD
jgi:hypothetical protein